MKLPERVKIGGFWYTIEAASKELVLRQVYGRTVHDDLNIKLDDERPSILLRETFLHEILHAAETFLIPQEELEERQIKILARVLFQVFTDNPEVRKFIFEDEE